VTYSCCIQLGAADSEVKFKKRSNGRIVHLPLANLSRSWNANSYGGIRATIEKGILYFNPTIRERVYNSHQNRPPRRASLSQQYVAGGYWPPFIVR
jgi:hypothetical protein